MRNLIAVLMMALILPVNVSQAASGAIAAVVNQDIISMTDLNDRLNLVIVSSGLPRTEEIRQKLTSQVLNDLIDEQLKVQEMKRNDLSVSQSEVGAGFIELAKQNNMTPAQFIDAMKRDGINQATMERQIRAQLGWSKVIQEVLRDQVTVTDSDIDEYIARFEATKGKSEYRVAEIFLPVNESNPDSNARQLAGRLVEELRAGKAPFFKVAQQFSGAAGASRGGDLGWIKEGQLQPEIDKVIATMEKNTVSEPIRTSEGYHIIYLRDARAVTGDMLPSRDQIYSTLGVQRLERLQARQLHELRTTAFIENRVQS